MEKREKFCGCVEGGIPIETLEPIGDCIDGWWIESRGGKHFAKRVAIAPAAMRPRRAASSGVVPRPMKGSKTTSPGFEYCSMK